MDLMEVWIMQNKSHRTINKITQLALFLAIGIILNIVESMIPLPIPIPGVKLGLANTIGLVLLYYYGPSEYLGVGFLRVLIVGVIRTGIGSFAFLLSLSGWLISSLVAVLLYFIAKKFVSMYGLSAASGAFHGVGQILMAMILYNTSGLVLYLGLLMVTGVISGLLTATVTSLILQKVDHHISFIVKDSE